MFPFPISLPLSLVSFSPTVPSPIFFLIISPVLFFRFPSSFPLLFLLISFLLFSLTDTCVVFFQLGASYYSRINYTDYHIPNISLDYFSASPIPISLRTRFIFSLFAAAYFDGGTYTNYEFLNFFTCLFLWIFFSSFHRTVPLSSDFSIVFFLFATYCLLYFRFIFLLFWMSRSTTLPSQAACFSDCLFLLGLRLGTLAPSYRWASAPLDWSTAVAFRFSCDFRLPPSYPI